jgi:DNA-binding NarL/FixJ family response regulator
MSKPTEMDEELGVRILVADASFTFLRVMTRFLCERSSAVVVGALGGGEDVLSNAQHLQPQIILIDPFTPMGNKSGLEVVSRLRAALPQVGIIVLTLMSSNDYRQAALAAGADDFVPKTAVYTDLLPVIQRVACFERLSV